MTTPEKIDEAAEAVQKPGALRVSLQDIRDNIAMVMYTTPYVCLVHGEYHMSEGCSAPDYFKSLQTMTVCYVVLKNGFIVIGKTAPADINNFDEALGRKFAFDNAIAQIWPLMGYELRQQIYLETQLHQS